MAAENAPTDHVFVFRDFIKAGFPAWQVADQLSKHLAGLRALPADTANRDEAIAQAEQLLKEIATD